MALSFPRTDILTGIVFSPQAPRFRPLWRQETSRTAGGITLVKDMGPLLWQASYLTGMLLRNRAGEIEADLLSLENGGQLFVGHDPVRPFPASDSVSTLTGVTVGSISGDRKALSLSGLPGGFTITKGDWISIASGSNLHLVRAVESGSGSVEVRPALRPEITTGNAVTLRYAPALFMVDPGSVQRSAAGDFHDTVSWSATQVIL